MNSSEYYGADGRLSQTAADAMIESAYRHDCADAEILLEGTSFADLAHAVALVEAGVIPGNVAPNLFRGLLELHEIPVREFPIRPELGDVYNSRENLLKQRIGNDAGWLHAGRPRREAVNIGFLLATRDRLLSLLRAHTALALAFVEKAALHRETFMPDFTYLHHAHPTTLAHYLLTYAHPMLRDLDRLSAAFQRVNSSPAGSGSVNGTRLPIDRQRLADLLGFGSIATHTRDAMWQPDVPIECMSAVVALMVNIDRFAEELQIWGTIEFDLAELPDGLSRASVIMPQKKNPYPLAYIRGLTGHLLAKPAAFAAVGKTYSGNPDSRIFIYGDLPRSLDRTAEAVRLFAAVIEGFTPNVEKMRQRSMEGFPEATDLAEHLMMTRGIDFRTAHHVVGKAVRLAIEGSESRRLAARFVNEAAVGHGLPDVQVSESELEGVIGTSQVVASRKGIGGAAPEQVDAMLGNLRNEFARSLQRTESETSRVTSALASLLVRSREIARGN